VDWRLLGRLGDLNATEIRVQLLRVQKATVYSPGWRHLKKRIDS
jgi:hypothetical protein